MFDLANPDLWIHVGVIELYRTLEQDGTYEPDEPFPSFTGRYSNGARLVLYLARTPEGAVAEYLRWHPELVDFQDDLVIELYALQFNCRSRMLNVQTHEQCGLIPFPYDRLTSSEEDVVVRYAECVQLANECEAAPGWGIVAPSAACSMAGAGNISLFGANGDSWDCNGVALSVLPHVDLTDISLATG